MSVALRRLADGDCDLHCGGVDTDEPLPAFLRRERFLDMTAGIVAWRDHPLFAGTVTPADLARYPWIDFNWPAAASLDETRPPLAAILAQLRGEGPAGIVTVLRLGAAGLLALAGGPWLAWLSTELLDRLPGGLIRPLPVEFGRYRYRSGFVARRSAEDLPPFRALEQTVRDTALAVDDSLAKREPVSIAGFGTFTTKSRPARQGRNPRTGEAIAIAASTAPAFKPGKALRDAVNAGRG